MIISNTEIIAHVSKKRKNDGQKDQEGAGLEVLATLSAGAVDICWVNLDRYNLLAYSKSVISK